MNVPRLAGESSLSFHIHFAVLALEHEKQTGKDRWILAYATPLEFQICIYQNLCIYTTVLTLPLSEWRR